MLVVNKPFRHQGREVAPGEPAPADLGPKLTNQLVRQKTLIETDPTLTYGVGDADARVRAAEVAWRQSLEQAITQKHPTARRPQKVSA